MHRHCCRVWALPPETEMKFTRFSEFGRFHHSVWALPLSLGAVRWWWPIFICIRVLGCQYYQTLRVLGSTSGSDTRAWFNRNGFWHSWCGVLRHISTSLAITEMRIGRLWLIHDLMRTSEAFRGRKEFGMGSRDTQLTTDESLRACVDILLSWDDELEQSGTSLGWQVCRSVDWQHVQKSSLLINPRLENHEIWDLFACF